MEVSPVIQLEPIPSHRDVTTPDVAQQSKTEQVSPTPVISQKKSFFATVFGGLFGSSKNPYQKNLLKYKTTLR
jgi:hypothetical protein